MKFVSYITCLTVQCLVRLTEKMIPYLLSNWASPSTGETSIILLNSHIYNSFRSLPLPLGDDPVTLQHCADDQPWHGCFVGHNSKTHSISSSRISSLLNPTSLAESNGM